MSTEQQPIPKKSENYTLAWQKVSENSLLRGDEATKIVLQSGKGPDGEPIGENVMDFLAAREAVLEIEFAKRELEEIEMKNNRAAKWAKEAGSNIEHSRPHLTETH